MIKLVIGQVDGFKISATKKKVSRIKNFRRLAGHPDDPKQNQIIYIYASLGLLAPELIFLPTCGLFLS